MIDDLDVAELVRDGAVRFEPSEPPVRPEIVRELRARVAKRSKRGSK